MSKTRKPQVITKCVANNYSAPNERIIEYTFGGDGLGSNIGGLIAFRILDDGTCLVSLYRHDPRVDIRVGKADG